MFKCCYFIRNVQSGAALDLTKCGENDLLFGEFGSSALGKFTDSTVAFDNDDDDDYNTDDDEIDDDSDDDGFITHSHTLYYVKINLSLSYFIRLYYPVLINL
jgi:hypothetical protein